MKAQAFLELVGEMLTAQQDYFSLKRKGIQDKAREALIRAKELEKRVQAVVKEGGLEPDEVRETNEIPAQYALDFSDEARPTDDPQKETAS